jgi:hypothetical protein
MEAECVLETLDRIGSPATMGMAGRRSFGFIIGGSLPAALAANRLAGAWDQCPGLFAASPIGTVLEEVSPRWLLDVLKLPGDCGGAFVTGAAKRSDINCRDMAVSFLNTLIVSKQQESVEAWFPADTARCEQAQVSLSGVPCERDHGVRLAGNPIGMA